MWGEASLPSAYSPREVQAQRHTLMKLRGKRRPGHRAHPATPAAEQGGGVGHPVVGVVAAAAPTSSSGVSHSPETTSSGCQRIGAGPGHGEAERLDSACARRRSHPRPAATSATPVTPSSSASSPTAAAERVLAGGRPRPPAAKSRRARVDVLGRRPPVHVDSGRGIATTTAVAAWRRFSARIRERGALPQGSPWSSYSATSSSTRPIMPSAD